MADEREGAGMAGGQDSVPGELKPLETWLQTDSAAWQAEVPANARVNEQARALTGASHPAGANEQAATAPTWPPTPVATIPPVRGKGRGPQGRWQIWVSAVAALLVVALMSVVLLSLAQHRGTTSVATESTATSGATASVAATATDTPEPSPTPLATATLAPSGPGSVIWSNATGGANGQPVVVDGVVYEAGGTSLWALNANTGELLWQIQTAGQVNLPIAVSNGFVVVMTQDSNFQSPLTAYRASDGSLVWTHQVAATAFSAPVAADGVVYAGAAHNDAGEGELDALDAATGNALWTFQYPGTSDSMIQVQSVPAVDNGVVYRSVWGILFALRVSDHTLLWKTPVSGMNVGVVNGVVYVGGNGSSAGITDADLTALSAATGTVLWTHTIKSAGGDNGSGLDGLGTPAVAGRNVYVYAANGSLYALDAGTGQELWTHSGSVSGITPPAADGTGVYVQSGGSLYALNTSDGSVRWVYQQGAGDPAVVNGVVYAGGTALRE